MAARFSDRVWVLRRIDSGDKDEDREAEPKEILEEESEHRFKRRNKSSPVSHTLTLQIAPAPAPSAQNADLSRPQKPSLLQKEVCFRLTVSFQAQIRQERRN